MFAAFAATFVAAWAGLALLHRQHKQAAATRTEQQFQASVQRLVDHVQAQVAGVRPRAASLGGRWRCGAVSPAIEVTIFSDYQCSDCAQADRQLREVVARLEQVGVIQKHAPLCRQCNPMVRSRSAHVHACRAAWAAEAAGLLGGNGAFWAVHGWLLQQQASFTDQQARQAWPQLGIPDPQAALGLMRQTSVRQRVAHDVAQALSLGITSTPLVLVNGMKMEGLGAPDALVRALEAAAAQLPAGDSPGDPPLAA